MIQEFRYLYNLQSYDGGILTERAGDATARAFGDIANNPNALPVVIPVRNEEETLPATLICLARAEALPIVVDNESEDRTVARAERMGAIVLHAPSVAKMGATLKGIEYSLGVRQATQVGFTDGDTLVPHTWAHVIQERLAGRAGSAAFFGHSFLTPASHLAANVLNNFQRSARNAKRVWHGLKPWAYGHNFALQFDAEGTLYDALRTLNPNLFQGDDTAIRDRAIQARAAVFGSMSLSTTVLTPGDRITSIRTLLSKQPGTKSAARLDSYRREYGERFDVYDKAKG